MAFVHHEHDFAETVLPAGCCGTGSLARPGERAVRWRPLLWLVPTFRSLCSVAAPTFTNFGKSWALENLLILVPLYRSEVPDRIRRLWCRGFRSAVLVTLAAGLAACSQEPDYTPEQRLCIASHFANYNPKQLNQCVDVCRLCMKGNVLTCNTSCRLRGAKAEQ
jgi:hypothetical protein